MTRWVLLGSVLGLSLGACGDDGTNGQLADAPSSAIDARGIDAPSIDAAPLDGPLDAPPDGPPLGVTVTVTLGGVPAPGQIVYFQSRDSAAAVEQLTNTDGNAVSVVEAGGFVTVVEPEPPLRQRVAIGSEAHLSTFAAVQPGDHLFVDVPLPAPVAASVTFTVNVPNEELGNNYTLYSPCGAQFIGRGNGQARSNSRARARAPGAIAVAPVSATITLSGCGATTDLLVVGDAGEGGPQSWQYQADVALVEGGTVDFVASYSPIDLQDFAYTVRAGTDRVDFTRELRTARGVLYAVSDSVFFDGTTGSRTIAMPTPEGVLAVTTSTAPPNAGLSEPSVIEWGPIRSSDVDFSALALHPYRSDPTFDIASHAITWTAAPDGTVPQLTIASFTATRTDEISHTWTWRLAGPYVEGQLAYPVLPTTLFDFNPRQTDEPFVQRLTTAQVPNGYNAARPRVFAGDLPGVVAGAMGRIVFEDMFTPPPPAVRKIASTLRRLGFTRLAR